MGRHVARDAPLFEAGHRVRGAPKLESAGGLKLFAFEPQAAAEGPVEAGGSFHGGAMDLFFNAPVCLLNVPQAWKR
jgi:hypothetical protein